MTRMRNIATAKASGPQQLFCLQIASVVDGVEVRLAAGVTCPYCGELIKNFPEETRYGWRLLCLSCHRDFLTADRLGSGSFADRLGMLLDELSPHEALKVLDATRATIADGER